VVLEFKSEKLKKLLSQVYEQGKKHRTASQMVADIFPGIFGQ